MAIVRASIRWVDCFVFAAANSETDASSQNGGSTTGSTNGSASGCSRDRSAVGGGAAKKENVCQVKHDEVFFLFQ